MFDGGSMVVAPDGAVARRAAMFEEALLVVDIEGEVASSPEAPAGRTREAGGPAEVYGALELGLRDYVTKNGFREVVLGLSGGIDSALVAVLAADALGRRGGSRGRDALAVLLAGEPRGRAGGRSPARDPARRHPDRRGLRRLPGRARPAVRAARTPMSRARTSRRGSAGTCSWRLSNAFGSIVLATGNKSEYAVGYSTLYGDMAGGFAPIKDVPKTLVYELALVAEPARRRAADPRSRAEQATVGGAPRRTRRTPTRCRPTRSSIP